MSDPWMSDVEIRSAVERVSFCALLGALGTRFSVDIGTEWITIGLSMGGVPDRDDDRLMNPLVMRERLLRHALLSERVLLTLLRRMVLRFVTHEAEESFLFSGQRIFDPHAEETRHNP